MATAATALGAGAAGTLFALLAAGCGSAPEPRARAVVLVTCDTLRADHLGCYGFDRPTTPRLDQVASESRLYRAAWSAAPHTGPALSALLTGLPPGRLGIVDNRNVLSSEAVTVADRLEQAGIETAAVVSNWVLRERDDLPGAGVRQGFAHFDDTMGDSEPNRPDLRERRASATTDAALSWLKARPHDQPFFLWVHYQDPHGPYTPPDDCLAPFRREPGGEPELRLGENQMGRGDLPAYQDLDGERRPDIYRQHYEGEIRYFDREFGRLVDELRAQGLWDEILFVFTADHGESLGERDWWFSHGHHQHRELLHVPLLVRLPGAPAPARIEAPVSHLDLYPTLLGALGVDAGDTLGRDLLAGAPPPDRAVFGFLRRDWSAATGTRRLVVEDGVPRLYDITVDPGETRDLAAEEPETVRTLQEALRALDRSGKPIAPARASLDTENQRRMDALGYVGGDDEH